jgi:signal transduction histidine kinase
MAGTLETLLAAARADTGGGTRAVSDAREAVAAAARTCDDAAGDRGVRMVVDLPPGAVLVGADAGAVERLLVPLIENARRYAARVVTVGAKRVDGEVWLSVSDDGPGVDDAVRDRLFEPGVSADGGAGHDGAGLGLALARRLARALSGDVEHVPAGAGATFRVRLPAV